jgi:hypothetical protein
MPRLTAAPIALTPAQAEELQRLARAHKTPRKLAERAEMILRSAAGTGVREIARQLGVWPKTVRHWRARWLALPAEVPVAARLADTARPGAPATASSSCWGMPVIRPPVRTGHTGGHAIRAAPVTSVQVWKVWALAARY